MLLSALSYARFEAIIFDLGGVILNLDFSRLAKSFEKLGVTDFESRYSQYKQNPIFDKFETGKISEEEFRKKLNELLGTSLSSKLLDESWNSLLLDFPRERIELLQKLKLHKRIFLLSNTNSIHARHYEKQFYDSFGFPFRSLFEKVYYSFEIGDRKPNLSIFERVIQENQLLPHQTLFIDDTSTHTDAARLVGLHTLHLKGISINDIPMSTQL
ncbi:MAG: HAD family phosphatase [Cytophagales bacterium]|nr:HAD family phosphatase [Cytophagales bacterium]MDW8384948.1 HAD family phosphatase [Flammeovirgaceae bacterium]